MRFRSNINCVTRFFTGLINHMNFYLHAYYQFIFWPIPNFYDGQAYCTKVLIVTNSYQSYQHSQILEHLWRIYIELFTCKRSKDAQTTKQHHLILHAKEEYFWGELGAYAYELHPLISFTQSLEGEKKKVHRNNYINQTQEKFKYRKKYRPNNGHNRQVSRAKLQRTKAQWVYSPVPGRCQQFPKPFVVHHVYIFSNSPHQSEGTIGNRNRTQLINSRERINVEVSGLLMPENRKNKKRKKNNSPPLHCKPCHKLTHEQRQDHLCLQDLEQ